MFQTKSKALSSLFGQNLDENGKGVVNSESLYLWSHLTRLTKFMNCTVVDCYHRLGMDVAGLGILGVELETLTSTDPKNTFLACYYHVINSPLPTAIISAINTQVPVRKFLPIEANLGYLRACRRIRDMIRGVVQQRVIDVENPDKDNSEHSSATVQGRDLLTMMVKQRADTKGSEDELSEEDMVDQVYIFFEHPALTSANPYIKAPHILRSRLRNSLGNVIMGKLHHGHETRCPGKAPHRDHGPPGQNTRRSPNLGRNRQTPLPQQLLQGSSQTTLSRYTLSSPHSPPTHPHP